MGETTAGWHALPNDLAGVVALPGDEAYEAWRKPRLARFHDIYPQAIVRCHTTADVSTALLFAHRHEISTTVRSDGHDFAGRSSTTGLLIDLGNMNDVALSGDVATVGAGTLLGDLYSTLSSAGRAIPGGSCPTVGVGGLTLGGGLGWLGRTYGLTCDALIGAEVVLPDGRVVWCDDEQDGDLFWALRGAGAEGPGAVTTMVFDTVEAPEWTVFEGSGTTGMQHASSTSGKTGQQAPPDRFTASLRRQSGRRRAARQRRTALVAAQANIVARP